MQAYNLPSQVLLRNQNPEQIALERRLSHALPRGVSQVASPKTTAMT